MRRLAADHRAQGDNRVVLFGFRELARYDRHLPGSRNLYDLDIFRRAPGASQSVQRAGQKQLVAEVTRIVAKISGDPTQAGRTWVLLTEAAEGGWGIAGTAFGKEEFAALAAKKK